MFLSKDSLATEIITAKSSEMNVMIPDGDEFVSLEMNPFIWPKKTTQKLTIISAVKTDRTNCLTYRFDH